jgi:hypothetical protein
MEHCAPEFIFVEKLPSGTDTPSRSVRCGHAAGVRHALVRTRAPVLCERIERFMEFSTLFVGTDFHDIHRSSRQPDDPTR